MRSWAGEVQSFTCPLPCGELRSRFVGLGDKKQQTEGGTIYWSNDDVRISNEVHQAAQLLLLCNGNAGIQRARKGTNHGHSSADRALCNCDIGFDWQPEQSARFSHCIKDLGFREDCAPNQSNLSLFNPPKAGQAEASPTPAFRWVLHP